MSPRTAGYSDAVSVLAQDRPSLAIVSGQGGAGRAACERVAELVMMAREQGRRCEIIAADRRSQMNLKQDERLSGELDNRTSSAAGGHGLHAGQYSLSTVAKTLPKETLTLLDGAARHNVQVLITDSGQRNRYRQCADGP